MGNPFSIPCDPCAKRVFDWLDEKVGYTHNLKKNLDALEKTMEEVKAKHEDLSRRVTREEERGYQRLTEFQVWLNRVTEIEKEVIHILSERDVQLQKLCLCGFCSKSLFSSYRYGKKVFLKLGEVQKLNLRSFEVVAEQAQTQEVEQIPIQPIIVGQETMLEKAWKRLMKDEVGMMGMYGMGGVGKTTLLTQLNNKFSNLSRGTYDFVIWVVVSKELQIEKILDEIARKVGLDGVGGWSQEDKSRKAIHLFNFLRTKKFVLFLDDIWEKVELDEIGIPTPTQKNGCKVAFTTRSQGVCLPMGDEDPMEVQCLSENDAFDLFQKKVGQKTLGSDPEIPKLARIVAKECCGLPLALNVIGDNMSCKKTVQEWRRAIAVLSSYAREFSGMEDKILRILKYSYDDLKGDEVKACLLYCALFPEDDDIRKEKLIEYWIGEGIIDGSKGIEAAEDEGYEIIGILVRASLLMDKVDWKGRDVVSMHDVVREMALWIASDLGIQKEAFIVHAGVGLDKMPMVNNWNVVRKMSLMKNKIQHLDGSPECLQLTTLLLQRTGFQNISSEFFKFMPKLVVLDLSCYSFEREPEFELHGISELVSLQYLNLSGTRISHLPAGLQELKKLIHLDLERTPHLQHIVGISSLQNLKVLKLLGSRCLLDLNTVEELVTMEHLEVLTTRIKDPGVLDFLISDRLLGCTRALEIYNIHMKSSGISLHETMEKLRWLSIQGCTISEIKMGRISINPLHNTRSPCFSSLSKVFIESCEDLRELTWLMFAPNLRYLIVTAVYELEDIINKEKACGGEESQIVPFPKLISLKLANLSELKSIYWSPLPFPCLKTIDVFHCPNLKKLPLDSQSGIHGENGLIIKGEYGWIEGVEWEDEATKTRFLHSFKNSYDIYDRYIVGLDFYSSRM